MSRTWSSCHTTPAGRAFDGGRRLIALLHTGCISYPVPVLNEDLMDPHTIFASGPAQLDLGPISLLASPIYDGARRFGATAHVLARAMNDAGPIDRQSSGPKSRPPSIVSTWRPLPSHQLVAEPVPTNWFQRLRQLRDHAQSPPCLSFLEWTADARAGTSSAYAPVPHVSVSADAAQFRRRHRAVGEGHEHAMFVISRTGGAFETDESYRATEMSIWEWP